MQLHIDADLANCFQWEAEGEYEKTEGAGGRATGQYYTVL